MTALVSVQLHGSPQRKQGETARWQNDYLAKDIDAPMSREVPRYRLNTSNNPSPPAPLPGRERGEYGTHFSVAVITAERDDYILLEPIQQQLKQQRQECL